MKIIKDKTYNKLIEAYAPKFSDLTYKELYKQVKVELKEAKDLKAILEKITPFTLEIYKHYIENGISFCPSKNSFITKVNLPDNVLVYVDDILGGKVIKQEGNKCIVISKDGKITEGLTKQKVDKGYSYKLVRE